MNEDNEIIEEVIVKAPKVKVVQSYVEAQRLVEEAKHIVKESDHESEACKLLLESDLKEYEVAKESLESGGLEVCVSLLEELGYIEFLSSRDEEANKGFEPNETIVPMYVQNVSSGRFTGLLSALLAGTVSLIGLVYLATEKLGMTLDISQIPSGETMGTIVSWFATLVGLEQSVYVGTAVLFVASASIMAVIYALRVILKGKHNMHFAQTQLEKAQAYKEAKEECNWEMDKVEVHMKETLHTLKMYEVLFREQKGKLERILHIEGAKSNEEEYHAQSLLEIRDTKSLIEMIQDFMAIAISDEGKLSEQSIQYLELSREKINKVLARFYQ
ncbi:MAG: hypothetical protein Q9M36_10410 [Sulfurovum sp.]|nr:hypothetical protein [Sulfurovum sp.]